MAGPIYDRDAPKKATNLSLNSDLVTKAKALGVNLSETLEARLAEIIAQDAACRFYEENKDAIDAYNEDVEKNGLWCDDLRPW